MKLFIRTVSLPLLLGLLAFAASATNSSATGTNRIMTVQARTANTAAPAAKAPEQPAEDSIEAPLPLSAFEIPHAQVEGRDPFFPNSSRVYGTDSVVSTNKTPSIVADLVLKGISGTPEQPLAIVNSTTFTTGEAGEVILKNGRRLKVVCVEINMTLGTTLMQIGAERRELKLATDLKLAPGK